MSDDRPLSQSHAVAEPERESAVILVQVPKERAQYVQQAIETLLSFAGVPNMVRSLAFEDALRPGPDQAGDAGQPRRNAKVSFLEIVHPSLGPGDALRELRRELGLSQADLARLTGLDRGHLAALERGERPMDEDVANRLGDVLKTNPAVFLR